MINVRKAVKKFGSVYALNELDLNAGKGSIYGLVGVNGAGKTTVIRNITGIQKPDSGRILLDGRDVYEDPQVKSRIGYVADEVYYMPGCSLDDMADYQAGIYSGWNEVRYKDLTRDFGMDPKRKLSTFSKGMLKQASLILALSVMPEWLILDEPIDGLDPVMRLKAWNQIIEDVAMREMTVLISSHNLREMEGYCDHIGIIAAGRMVIERDLEDLKSDIHKVQVAFTDDRECEFTGLDVCHRETRGSVEIMIIKESREKIENMIGAMQPAVFDILPLTLEEVFIYELGGKSDEIKKII